MRRVSGWRGFLVLLAVCSLTLIVATRYSFLQVTEGGIGHAVKAKLAEPKGQRLAPADSGMHGLPRFERLAAFTVCLHEPQIVLDGCWVRSTDLDHAIFNRPPPIAGLS